MDKFIYLVVGAALTWLFYFVQRRVERRGAVEVIERNQKLLDLKQGLDTPTPTSTTCAVSSSA